MRLGRVVEMCDAQLTLHDTEVNVQWKLPYAEIEPPQPGVKPARADFRRGDKVSFTNRHLQDHVGVITRCNPKTASVDSDGQAWSVSYGALRQVLDV